MTELGVPSSAPTPDGAPTGRAPPLREPFTPEELDAVIADWKPDGRWNGDAAPEPDDGPYRVTPGGLVWVKPTREGEVEIPLATFDARIRREILLDDGVEPALLFELEVRLGGTRWELLRLTAAELVSMEWPLKRLGTGAVISAGLGNRDRVREAIQRLSGEVPRDTRYAHTGWRELGDEWAYLHASGAIGAAGEIEGAAVELPDTLARFELPTPPSGRALVEAIHASLRFLELGPPRGRIPSLRGDLARCFRASGGLHAVAHGPDGHGENGARCPRATALRRRLRRAPPSRGVHQHGQRARAAGIGGA